MPEEEIIQEAKENHKLRRRTKAKLYPEKPYITKEESEVLKQIRDIEGPTAVIDPISLQLQGPRDKKYLRIFKKSVLNGGDLRKAMREEGYSLATSRQPGVVANTKAWKTLMNYYFPPDLLAKKNLELLNHEDWRATNAALERLHKLRGDFVQKVEHSIKSNDDYRQLSDEDLKNIVEGEIIEQIPDPNGPEPTGGAATTGSEA